VVQKYLKSHQVRKLQIGAGQNVLPGWLNTDKFPRLPRVFFLNTAKPFPLSDATIDYVYSEHLIEHLTYKQGQLMLRECFRILKPGGGIRTATPDLEKYVGLFTPQKSNLQQKYIHWHVDNICPEIGIYQASIVINNAFRKFGHQFLYDFCLLQNALEKAGFVAITRCNVGESDDEVFRGVEFRTHECMSFETMVVEARRPL
jgi:predicted SAM-dependent methyltransferase